MRQRVRRLLLLSSFLLFPITIFYLSPYIIVVGAIEGVVNMSALVFLGQFTLSLIFGRAFCGWICPGGGLGECATYVQNKKAPGGKLNWIKFFIWVPWIATIIILPLMMNGIVKVDPFFHMVFESEWGVVKGVSVSNPYAYFIYLPMVFLVFILAVTSGKRGFCHYVCWMAPFMIIGRRIRGLFKYPSLGLKAKPANCVDCKLCAKVCPMSLDVPAMVKGGSMRNDECVLCGECVDACKKGALSYTFFGAD